MLAHKLDSDGGIAGWCILLASPALHLVPKLAALAGEIAPIADRLTRQVRHGSSEEVLGELDALCEQPEYRRLLSLLTRFCWDLPKQELRSLAATPMSALASPLGPEHADKLEELNSLFEHALRLMPDIPQDVTDNGLETFTDAQAIIGDLSIPSEVAELLIDGLRGQAALLAISIASLAQERFESWRSATLMDAVLTGFRGEVRLLAACRQLSPPLGLPPFDLEAAERNHARVRLGLGLMQLQAEHSQAPIWPAAWPDDDAQ